MSQRKETVSKLPGPDKLQPQNRFCTLKKVVLNKDAWTAELNRTEGKTVLDAFYQTLFHLDGLFGRTYMKTQTASSQKYFNDQSNSDKKSKLLLFKQCIAIIPKFIIPEEIIANISEMLARLSLHIDEDMANCAFAVLKILIVDYSQFSSRFIQHVINAYLLEVPINCTVVNSDINTRVKSLIQLWKTCLSNENPHFANPEGLYLIEAFCIITLLNSNDSERQSIYQIMKETKSIHSLFIQNEHLQPSVYEEIVKYLVDYNPFRSESYSNVDILKLLEQSLLSSPWHIILGLLLRDSQIALCCPITIKYVQQFGFIRFKQVFSAVDSRLSYSEASTRLTLTRTKKSVSFNDLQDLQNLMAIFCCPSISKPSSSTSSLSNLLEATSFQVASNISYVFDKVVHLFRSDDWEVCRACVDVLCLMHSSVILTFIKSITPLFKDITDVKADLSSRKKRKRDLVSTHILKIFASVSKNQHLVTFICSSQKQAIQPLIEFCDYIRGLIAQNDVTTDHANLLADLATTISGICYGLYNSKNNEILSIQIREQFYHLFLTNLDNDLNSTNLSQHQRECLYEAMFTTLYAENILSEKGFCDKINEILSHISLLQEDTHLENKVLFHSLENLVLNTINILLNLNEFNPVFINWILHVIYSKTSDLSIQLSLCLLDYFEKNNLTQDKYVNAIVLGCILLLFSDPIIYLRVVKFLTYLQRIFKMILLDPHSDYSFTNKLEFYFPGEVAVQCLDFETSIFTINNLIYATETCYEDHSSTLKECWISLTCYSNQNFQLVLHYLIALSHNEDDHLHALLKTIFGFIYSYSSEYFREFLFTHLKNEQNPKLKISSCQNYPHITVCSFSYVNRVCIDKKLINPAHSKSYQTLRNEEVLKSSWFYCCPIHQIIKECPLISYYCALLSVSSYVISFGPIPMDEPFMMLLHLSINEMFNSSAFTSTVSKYILVSLCMKMLNASELLNEKRLLYLSDSNSLMLSLTFSKASSLSHFRPTSQLSLETDPLSELLRTVESIKCSSRSSSENGWGDFNNQCLYKLLESLKSFIHHCGLDDWVHNLWREICVHFSTKCSSINISCFSLFVLRIIGVAIDYKNLKKLMMCYVKMMTESFPDVKKFKYEILLTIHTSSMFYTQKNPTTDTADRQNVLALLVWFFSNHLLLSGPSDLQTCFTFINQYFALSTGVINDILFIISHTIVGETSFISILINVMFRNSQFQNQCLSILLKLCSCLIHPFVFPDEILGLKLIGLILAFYFIDFFDPAFVEIPDYFMAFILEMKNVEKLSNLYKIFSMFQSCNKRKDINLFLNILFPEILEGSDKRIIQILIKFLTDIVGLSESRCIKNSLHLLNSLVDHVGSHNIAPQSKHYFLQNLPTFIKNKLFGKITYELSNGVFEKFTIPLTSCPHEFASAKFKSNHEYKCSVCEPGILKTAIYNSFMEQSFFFDPEPSSFESKIIKFFENAGIFDERDVYQLEMYVADIPLDYDLRTQQPTSDKFNSSEENSVDSTVLVDDILESLAFLDQEWDKKDFYESAKTISRKGSTISSLSPQTKVEQNLNHSAVPVFEKSGDNHENLDISMSPSFQQSWISENNQEIFLADSETQLKEQSSSENESKRILENPIETKNPTVTIQITPEYGPDKTCNDYLLHEMPFSNDEKIYEVWVESYLKCIHSTYKNQFDLAGEKFILVINLMPLLIESSLLKFFSVIKLLYESKSCVDVSTNVTWLNHYFMDLGTSIESFFVKYELPFYLILKQNKKIHTLQNDKNFSLIVKMSNSIEKIFYANYLMHEYTNNHFELTEDHLNMMIHSGRILLTPPVFKNIKKYLSNRNTLSDQIQDNLTHNFLQILIFDLLKSTDELIQNYLGFLDQMNDSMQSFGLCNISQKIPTYLDLYPNNSDREYTRVFKSCTLRPNIIHRIMKSHFFMDLFDMKKYVSEKKNRQHQKEPLFHSEPRHIKKKFSTGLSKITISPSQDGIDNCYQLPFYYQDEAGNYEIYHEYYSKLKLFRNSYLHDLIFFQWDHGKIDNDQEFKFISRGSYAGLSTFSKAISEMFMSFLTTILDTD
ncbi:Protein furry -like protein [Thelohanellus kitauei]|uniref:Protein furry-like protein n=1 Tax=Thelohanellus kitauei TaxID=669202 RepID=A0A0C2JA68_THEKT|nr:Protein furry -like protein [Thelohanellus kitauei]